MTMPLPKLPVETRAQEPVPCATCGSLIVPDELCVTCWRHMDAYRQPGPWLCSPPYLGLAVPQTQPAKPMVPSYAEAEPTRRPTPISRRKAASTSEQSSAQWPPKPGATPWWETVQ